MIRTSLITGVTLAGLIGLGVSAARADVTVAPSTSTCGAGLCTQIFDTGNTATPWIARVAPNNGTLEDFHVALFDPSLGTLTGAKINITFGATITNGTLFNAGPTPQTFTFNQDTALSISTGGLDSSLDAALAGLAIDPKYTLQVNNLAAGGSVVLATPITRTASASLTIPSATLALSQLVGVGTETFFSGALSNTSYLGTGNIADLNALTDARAQLTVSYYYTPKLKVPEPLTAALLGSALIGFGIVRRRAR